MLLQEVHVPKLFRAGLASALILTLAACSGSASSAPPAAPSTAASAAAPSSAASAPASAEPSAVPSASAGGSAASGSAVAIANFAFDPKDLTVKVGDTVTWTNNDSTDHTVALDDGSSTSPNIPQGGTYQMTFSKAGTVAYHCSIHPSMTATITVSG
jgi:plastocyanin